MKKLERIMLIDDDEGNNFYNKFILREVDASEEIVVFQNGIDALNYLNQKHLVNLILLDVNMPKMNGWEFLDEYEKLDQTSKDSIIVVMLTSSINPDDQQRAQSYSTVRKFMNKPIEPEMVEEVLKLFG